MPRVSKPWWWVSRQSWYVQIAGRRHNLGPDRAAAHQRYHELMAQPRKKPVAADSVVAIIDAFLDWTSKHRASATYEWYRLRLQGFCESIPRLENAVPTPSAGGVNASQTETARPCGVEVVAAGQAGSVKTRKMPCEVIRREPMAGFVGQAAEPQQGQGPQLGRFRQGADS